MITSNVKIPGGWGTLKASNKRFGQRGASLVEYALLVSLIAVISISALKAFGNEISNKYVSLAGNVANAEMCGGSNHLGGCSSGSGDSDGTGKDWNEPPIDQQPVVW